MRSKSLILLFIFCCSLGVVYANAEQNVCIVYRKDGKLNFDGKLNDAVWEGKLIAKTFYKSKELGQAQYQTEIYAMWDEEYLYFGAKMYDEDIIGNLTKRDDPIYNEDAFEIFIKPNKSKKFIYEFEFSPLGTIWDGLNSRRALPATSGYREVTTKAWNAEGILCAVHVEGTINNWEDKDKYWSLEIKIPLKNFTFRNIASLPKKGDEWNAIFARCESSVYLDDVEYSASIPLSKYGVWENYAEWGKLVFK